MQNRVLTYLLGGILLLASCAGKDSPAITPDVNTLTQTITSTDTETYDDFLPTPSETSEITHWEDFPVIPTKISQKVIEIFHMGEIQNNRNNVFSIIGDCLSTPTYFLTNYDGQSSNYKLGDFTNLQPVIVSFQGSFSRESLAVGKGFNAASVLSPFWANTEKCFPGENPLQCELRENKPGIAFILLGTNDASQNEDFEAYLRTIVNETIESGVVPVLATKADNLEGGQRINEIITRVASEYEIPLWNFWLAVQPLPNHGLKEDGTHLTWAEKNYDFSNSQSMESAWTWRNLTFLQVLDFLWRNLK